jgi:outer membrane protein assembly factor BamA
MIIQKFYSLVFLCSLTVNMFGQVSLKLSPTRSADQHLLPKYKNKHTSAKEAKNELINVQQYFYKNGHLAFSVDSLYNDSANIVAYIQIGPVYKWAKIKKGNIDELALSSTGFKEKLYRNKIFSVNETNKLFEKLISYYENNGYPFASVKFDSVSIRENTAEAVLWVEKSTIYKTDSIIIHGNTKTSPYFIQNYIGIKQGNIYNENSIKRIEARLKELPFIKIAKPPEVVFMQSESRILLYLDEKKASNFNGIVGVLPDNTGKTLITGDVKLRLQNALSSGELIDANWRKLQTNTQDMRTLFNVPFLFKSPFGFDFDFKLYKRDTLFLTVDIKTGVQYFLQGGRFFRVFIHRQNSNLLSTKSFEKDIKLPPFADIAVNLYGIGYRAENLDYRLNPRKGYRIDISGSTGLKSIRQNGRLNPAVYDSVKLKTNQYRAELDLSYFLPIRKRSTLKTANSSAYLLNQNMFENELYRIGGLKTLRGFNEESIFASSYSIFTFEYRYLLEENSYFHLFFDGAWYEKKLTNSYVKDTPFGFGAGVSFETKAGIFSINYALGKQFNNPILVREGKIHFGFVSLF